MNKKIIMIIFVALFVALGGYAYYNFVFLPNKYPESEVKAATTANGLSKFNKSKLSKSNPNSIWVVVNKQRPINPKTYVPSDLVVPSVGLRVPGNESMQLRAAAAKALINMFDAATKDNINLMLSSGYRSYNYQVNLYGNYVNTQGQAVADTQSARPGYSEHQTGLAVDLRPTTGQCELDKCFGELPEGKWVAENAYKYGFIIRYPEGSESIVGYEYEPWHIRYVGVDLATNYHNTNATTLEEYFDLPPAPNYK